MYKAARSSRYRDLEGKSGRRRTKRRKKHGTSRDVPFEVPAYYSAKDRARGTQHPGHILQEERKYQARSATQARSGPGYIDAARVHVKQQQEAVAHASQRAQERAARRKQDLDTVRRHADKLRGEQYLSRRDYAQLLRGQGYLPQAEAEIAGYKKLRGSGVTETAYDPPYEEEFRSIDEGRKLASVDWQSPASQIMRIRQDDTPRPTAPTRVKQEGAGPREATKLKREAGRPKPFIAPPPEVMRIRQPPTPAPAPAHPGGARGPKKPKTDPKREFPAERQRRVEDIIARGKQEITPEERKRRQAIPPWEAPPPEVMRLRQPPTVAPSIYQEKIEPEISVEEKQRRTQQIIDAGKQHTARELDVLPEVTEPEVPADLPDLEMSPEERQRTTQEIIDKGKQPISDEERKRRQAIPPWEAPPPEVMRLRQEVTPRPVMTGAPSLEERTQVRRELRRESQRRERELGEGAQQRSAHEIPATEPAARRQQIEDVPQPPLLERIHAATQDLEPHQREILTNNATNAQTNIDLTTALTQPTTPPEEKEDVTMPDLTPDPTTSSDLFAGETELVGGIPPAQEQLPGGAPISPEMRRLIERQATQVPTGLSVLGQELYDAAAAVVDPSVTVAPSPAQPTLPPQPVPPPTQPAPTIQPTLSPEEAADIHEAELDSAHMQEAADIYDAEQRSLQQPFQPVRPARTTPANVLNPGRRGIAYQKYDTSLASVIRRLTNQIPRGTYILDKHNNKHYSTKRGRQFSGFRGTETTAEMLEALQEIKTEKDPKAPGKIKPPFKEPQPWLKVPKTHTIITPPKPPVKPPPLPPNPKIPDPTPKPKPIIPDPTPKPKPKPRVLEPGRAKSFFPVEEDDRPMLHRTEAKRFYPVPEPEEDDRPMLYPSESKRFAPEIKKEQQLFKRESRYAEPHVTMPKLERVVEPKKEVRFARPYRRIVPDYQPVAGIAMQPPAAGRTGTMDVRPVQSVSVSAPTTASAPVSSGQASGQSAASALREVAKAVAAKPKPKAKKSGISRARKRYTDTRKAKLATLRSKRDKSIRLHKEKTKKMPKKERDKARREFKKKLNDQYKETVKRFPPARGMKDVGTVLKLIKSVESARFS